MSGAAAPAGGAHGKVKGRALSQLAYSHSARKPGVSGAGQRSHGEGAAQDVPTASAGQGLPAGSWVPLPLAAPQLECPASARAASCAAGCLCCPCGPRSWFRVLHSRPGGVVCYAVTTLTDFQKFPGPDSGGRSSANPNRCGHGPRAEVLLCAQH